MTTSNQTVIVTGAARGIGRATATEFAGLGYNVVLADIDLGAARAAARDLDAERCMAVEMDVADRDSVQKEIDTALDAFDGIDVLVNNAGVQTDLSFLDLAESEWNHVLDVNLKGLFLVGQQVANAMIEQEIDGRIINVTSIHQSVARRNRANYDAAKAGAWMLTKDMALELAPHRINVNAVAPGAVETPMNETVLQDAETRDEIASQVPWDRWAAASEIAEVIRFFGHDAPDYLTGGCLRVDGGLSLVGVV